MFNVSLEGNTRRAIDFHEGDPVDEQALKALNRKAIALKVSKWIVAFALIQKITGCFKTNFFALRASQIKKRLVNCGPFSQSLLQSLRYRGVAKR